MARREERAYREYVSDEQRSQPGCPARELCDESLLRDTSWQRVRVTPPTWHAKAAKAAKEYILSLRPLRPLRSIVAVRSLVDQRVRADHAHAGPGAVLFALHHIGHGRCLGQRLPDVHVPRRFAGAGVKRHETAVWTPEKYEAARRRQHSFMSEWHASSRSPAPSAAPRPSRACRVE